MKIKAISLFVPLLIGTMCVASADDFDKRVSDLYESTQDFPEISEDSPTPDPVDAMNSLIKTLTEYLAIRMQYPQQLPLSPNGDKKGKGKEPEQPLAQLGDLPRVISEQIIKLRGALKAVYLQKKDHTIARLVGEPQEIIEKLKGEEQLTAFPMIEEFARAAVHAALLTSFNKLDYSHVLRVHTNQILQTFPQPEREKLVGYFKAAGSELEPNIDYILKPAIFTPERATGAAVVAAAVIAITAFLSAAFNIFDRIRYNWIGWELPIEKRERLAEEYRKARYKFLFERELRDYLSDENVEAIKKEATSMAAFDRPR